MLLHIGDDRSVRLRDVEAIFDAGLFVSRNPANREFLASARAGGRVEGGESPPGSLVLAGRRVLLCPLSRFTLARRAAGGLRALAGAGAGPWAGHGTRTSLGEKG